VIDRVLKFPPDQEAIRAKCFHPSGTFVDFAKEEIKQSIPERFEKIVRMYPERIAVKEGDRIVTYAELDGLANNLAREILVREGDKPEPIILLLEKGAPWVAAMLGVLKAGKIFVLSDPSLPKARIASVIEGSQAGLLITSQHNLCIAQESAGSRLRVLDIETIKQDLSVSGLGLHIECTAFAYIVYTSGSTGQPKGVVQSHESLLHNIRLRTCALPVYCDDKFALLSSGTANAVTSTFLALLNGAALLPFDVRNNGVARLADWLVQEKITFLPMSSPLFRNFCHALTRSNGFPDLRILRLMSDTITRRDTDLYKKYFSSKCVLINGLHGTETGAVSLYLISHESHLLGSEVPVGYSLEDKEIRLLDEDGNDVGFNQIGEIVIRSKYLSPGYWRRPDLNETKFMPDPKGGEERLYFTGDLGLMLSDGCLIHKGRKDFRVKVRGYGVEIAEVEKALRDHAAISEVVVVGKQDESGETRLVAYFISHGPSVPYVTELRRFLGEKLPDYMIPSTFVALETFPLTPNGKIDRKALPTPGKSRPALDTVFEEPRTPIEKELAQTWSEILSLQEIGVNDNFFDLGGHSLAATRVVTQVIKKFKLEMPLHALFAAPTVAEMAAVITASQGKKIGEANLERMLAELESLSEDEALRLIGEESGKRSDEGCCD